MLEKESFYNLRNRNVKRMLWPVDHDQIKTDLRKEQEKMTKELTEKYNFDFDSSQPLHGKYDWAHVGSESPLSSPCLIEQNGSCSSTSARVENKKISQKTRPTKRTKKVKTTESTKKLKTDNTQNSNSDCQRKTERKKSCRNRK